MADDPAEEIFEVITTRNFVLLDDILKKMTIAERAEVLTSYPPASDQYHGSGEVLDDYVDIYVEEEGVGYYPDYPLFYTSQRKIDGVDEDGAEPLLVTAVRNGDLDSVKVLLKYKADVEVQEHDLRDNWFSITRASLFWAVDFGYIDILRCLIENGVDVNSFSVDCTPLMKAVENGDKDIVTFLIDHGANVAIKDKCGYTALHRACVIYHDCSPEVLSCLIENGADVNLSTDNNRTPLMTACEYGHVNTVTILIEHGANVNLQDRDGLTAVHYAVHGSQACEILSCLMENGADVDAKTFDDCTPLMIAAEIGDTKVATFLIEHGANVDLPDKTGATALYYALSCPGNMCEVMSCLIENGADINACTSHNCPTPLMMACVNDQLNAVTFLIEHGALVNLQDKDGHTALHYAVQENSGSHEPYEVLDYLIQNGADVNAKSNEGTTPLMKASELSKVNIATSLIKQGANMYLRDKNGDTALHYAVHTDSPEIADSLLTLGASCSMYNNWRLTPLLLASSTGKSKVVENLIKRPEIKEQRIDALELLGASIITKYDDFELGVEKGLKYIKRGMKERFADPSQPLVKPTIEPVEAYQNRKECQTLEELALIEDDLDALVMESLIIRERILGKTNAELLSQIRKVASFYLRVNNDLSISLSLRAHAMKKAQTLHLSTVCDLYFITDNLVNRDVHSDQKEVLELLKQTVLEYEKLHSENLGKTDNDDLFCTSLNLIEIISRYGFCGDSNTSALLEKLCSQNPRDKKGNTLLHCVINKYCIGSNSFQSLDALKLLLKVEFCVNAVNDKGDTLLHLVVTTFKPWGDDIHLLTDIMEALFDEGAHHDFANNDGKTPMDVAKTDEARMILSERRKLELMCISARAVKKFEIPYLGVVPKILEKYISMH